MCLTEGVDALFGGRGHHIEVGSTWCADTEGVRFRLIEQLFRIVGPLAAEPVCERATLRLDRVEPATSGA